MLAKSRHTLHHLLSEFREHPDSSVSCPMLTGLGQDKRDFALRTRVNFLTTFASEHRLIHSTTDDFCPYRTVEIILHCCRSMGGLNPLYWHRLKLYYRRMRQLRRWLRGLVHMRNIVLEEVVRRWIQYEPLKGGNTAVESGEVGRIEDNSFFRNAASFRKEEKVIELRRKAAVSIYYKKRADFRDKYRSHQTTLTSKQAELAQVTKLLKQGSQKEMYMEALLRDTQASLTKEIKQLLQEPPRFSIKFTDFTLSELQNALKFLNRCPIAPPAGGPLSPSAISSESSSVPTLSPIGLKFRSPLALPHSRSDFSLAGFSLDSPNSKAALPPDSPSRRTMNRPALRKSATTDTLPVVRPSPPKPTSTGPSESFPLLSMGSKHKRW